MNPLPVLRRLLRVLFSVGFAAAPVAWAASEPVTPNAMPEACALLQLLHEISGRYTLTGQHNYPNIRDRNTRFASRYIGETPVVFSTDFGFAKPGDTDSYLARPDIVQECIRQHRLGSLITICWHAVPPTADEPITFRKQPNSDSKALASVQGQLLDEQFKELLTPGTPLYNHWCAQVDAIAGYLKQLQDAHVPVLWRPYHEMNGDWFWWGGRTGEFSTERLYRQIFDRLVNHHQLKNLIWVWSVDRVTKPEMAHEKYFPGLQYVDVLGLDVYRNDFAQKYYDSLEKLSGGKPLTLAEVGNPPSLEILQTQPRWTYYVVWAGMVRNTTRKQYDTLMQGDRYLNLDDALYSRTSAGYRRVCGFEPVSNFSRLPDFSGTWLLNEDRSDFGRTSASSAPTKLEIIQRENSLLLRSTRILEFVDDQVSEESIALDGSEAKSEFMNSPRVTTAFMSSGEGRLKLHTTTIPNWAPGTKIVADETWTLIEHGRFLSVHRVAQSPMGPQESTLLYERR
jgi:mannan endo-1,4-beta-mannosidase